MKLPRLTVAQKIAAGYLLVVIFCLAAIVYALMALASLKGQSEQLVAVEFRAFNVARDLSGSLLDHERLERQILILRDPAMVALLDKRAAEIDTAWSQLAKSPLADRLVPIRQAFAVFQEASSNSRALLAADRWPEAEQHSLQSVSPRRARLVEVLDQFRQGQEALMDATMQSFSEDSSRAYRLTLALAFAGIGLALLVAIGVILKMHRALAQLTQATKAIAAGSFDYPIALDSQDEFGRLARAFADMEAKLRELEALHLDANPLTRLPGSLAINQELANRIASVQAFAHIYIDLDYFKAYNDRYGYQAGSDIIARVGVMVADIVQRLGNKGDLTGHIGGDDYVVLSTPDRAVPIAQQLIKEFDALVPELYSEQDRKAGFFKGKDRYGEVRQFPLLSMSVAIICSENLRNPTIEAIGRECAKMKEHLKKLPGSNYLVDRREKR